MNETRNVIVWQVVWEERRKVKCRECCTDENHPWIDKSAVYTTAEQAHDQEDALYDLKDNDNYSIEVRNVQTYSGEVHLQETYLVRIPAK